MDMKNLPPSTTAVNAVERIWERLIELEPRLLDLYRYAQSVKDNKRKRSFCPNDIWYGYRGWPGLKNELCRLVGWGAAEDAHPFLRTSLAYRIAYHRCYDPLPPCRGCVCWGFRDYINVVLQGACPSSS